MADGKWIPDLRPELSLREAAQVAICTRLAGVEKHLPLAVASAAEDAEHVHQLRVGIRRLSAALRTFKRCLSRRRRRVLRDLLREIRRSAGMARDWDVFQEMLTDSEALREPEAKAAYDFLAGCAAARRIDAQAILIESGPRWESTLQNTSDELLKRIRPVDGGPSTLGDLALTEMLTLTRQLAEASDPIPESYSDLHRVRILGKRIRYAMELFAECFDAPFRERLYPLIEELQEILGHANDSHVAAERLKSIREHLQTFRLNLWPAYQPGIDALIESHKRQIITQRNSFAEWLPRWRAVLAEMPLISLRGNSFGAADAGAPPMSSSD